MRIKTFKNGGYSTEGFSTPGGTLTGPLMLSRHPVEDLEAATKYYVDTNLDTFSASDFTTGVIPVGRLPAFTGDLSSVAGSSNLSFSGTGVGTGSYTKVTVNSKGLVVDGTGLDPTDIPNISWGKIGSGKPTTLAGYGITDALPLTGGNLTGNLTLHSDPVNNLHAATKQYTENTLAGSGATVDVGFIVRKSTAVTPTGFLKCNGGFASKTSYSSLYSKVGDVFGSTSDTFKLPDLTSSELSNNYSYIKT